MNIIQQWVCKKRGVCKSWIHSKNNIVIKSVLSQEIRDSHTHGRDLSRIEMLKGWD